MVAGAYYFYTNSAASPADTTGKQAVQWSFADKGEQAGVPHTEVSLNGRIVGTYEGSCKEIDGTSWQLLEGEQSGVICYFAGGGTEIGIFGNAVKVGEVSEGSAEVAGSRGNFVTAFTL